jgi:uncharacterized protein YjdB
MRFSMKRALGYVIVFSSLFLWAGCNALFGPDWVEVSPEHPTVAVGATQQFRLRAIYTNPPSGSDVTRDSGWSSSNPAVATISATGLATAIAPGETLITGRYQGDSDDTRFTVTP